MIITHSGFLEQTWQKPQYQHLEVWTLFTEALSWFDKVFLSVHTDIKKKTLLFLQSSINISFHADEASRWKTKSPDGSSSPLISYRLKLRQTWSSFNRVSRGTIMRWKQEVMNMKWEMWQKQTSQAETDGVVLFLRRFIRYEISWSPRREILLRKNPTSHTCEADLDLKRVSSFLCCVLWYVKQPW